MYSSADGCSAVVASGSTSPIAVTGLTNGTAFTFKTAAYDAAGTLSTKSSASNAVTPAAPAPTTLVADNFNRADGSPVGAGSVGPAAVTNPSPAHSSITSNAVAFFSPTVWVNWPAGVADYAGQIANSAGSPPAIYWRFADPNNSYSWNPNGQIYKLIGVYKLIGGTPTSIAGPDASRSFAGGDTPKVDVVGSAHALYVHGTQVCTFTDSGSATGDYAVSGESYSRLDKLRITTP